MAIDNVSFTKLGAPYQKTNKGKKICTGIAAGTCLASALATGGVAVKMEGIKGVGNIAKTLGASCLAHLPKSIRPIVGALILGAIIDACVNSSRRKKANKTINVQA